MTSPSILKPHAVFPWTGCAVAALLVAVALAPWPTWWSNLFVYHGEPQGRWRVVLGAIAVALAGTALASSRFQRAIRRVDAEQQTRRTAITAAFVGVFLIAAALPRLYWPADWVKLGAPDHAEYALGALNLLERGTYAIELNGKLYPPRYPFGYSTFFVAPVLAVTGPEPRHAVYASLFSGIGVVVLLAAVAWRGFGGVTASVSVFLLLVYPLFLKYTREVLADAALTALFLGVFAGALWLRPGRWRWLVFGASIGLAASVKFSLVFAAVFPWLAVRLRDTQDDAPETACRRPSDGWFGRLRRRFPLDLCLAAGIGIGVLPTLIYNARTFGEPLRTGYHYWCSVPYDFPSLTFSPRFLWTSADGTGPGNLVYYLLPGGEMTEKTPYFAIQLIYWLLVLGGMVLGWNAPGVTRRAVRLTAAGAGVQFAFFAMHFYANTRLLLPVYVLLLPAGVYAVVRILRVPLELERSRTVALLAAVFLAAGFWLIGPHYVQFRDIGPGYRNVLTAAADRLLPDDALIISDLDGAFVTHYLLEGTRREYLPLDRGVEYASKYAQPRRPPAAQPPTDDPFDHRAIPAKAWNAVEVYPQTALENPDEIARRLQKGQTCFAILADPHTARKLPSIGIGVYFEQVEPGVGVFRATYSLSSGP